MGTQLGKAVGDFDTPKSADRDSLSRAHLTSIPTKLKIENTHARQ
jgi:hypothetical protein